MKVICKSSVYHPLKNFRDKIKIRNRVVEIQSREQVALEDANMICLTSAVVAGANCRRAGEETTGERCGDM